MPQYGTFHIYKEQLCTYKRSSYAAIRNFPAMWNFSVNEIILLKIPLGFFLEVFFEFKDNN
jgi:hypothetical protein